MRINYTMFGLEMSGGTKIILRQAHLLAKKGHQVSITVLGKRQDFRKIPISVNVPIIYVPQKLNPDASNLEFIIGELARHIPVCEINIATFCFTAFAVHKSGKGRGFYYMQHFEPLFFKPGSLLETLARKSYKLPLKKIANSTWLVKTLRKEIGISEPISIVPSAIDLTVFCPLALKPRKKIRVVAMARPAVWKGFSEVETALCLIKQHYAQVEFWAFRQPGSKMGSFVADRIFDKLSEKQLAELYASAHIIVSSSWYESSPLMVLEAMASGAAVVTTPMGTEDIITNGRNGLVVPPRDPQALVVAISRLIDDFILRRRLRREALKTVKAFVWEKTIPQVEKIFKEEKEA